MNYKYFIICFICILLNSCTDYIDDYVIVENVYFFDKTIIPSFKGMKEIKYAILPMVTDTECYQQGAESHSYYIDIGGIEVYKGCISFFTKNGRVDFLPLHKVRLHLPPQNKIKHRPPPNVGIFDCSYGAARLNLASYRVGSTPELSFGIVNPAIGATYHEITSPLEYKTKNGYWLISIPLEISDDFEGETGSLNISPKYFWYEI